MNLNFFVISILIISGLTGSVFAQQSSILDKIEFTQEEIDKMKQTAVIIRMHEATMMLEFYPEDAPNTVHHFLKLAESGYYDGIVFHRIIPGFMIQAGDPNTKDPESDRSLWGSGDPGYSIREEFNTLQHDRGAVSMARGNHIHSAGSQFFIVHNDSNFLDGKYTVFGRLVPGTHSLTGLDRIASIQTDARNAPIAKPGDEIDPLFLATIQSMEVIHPYTATGLGELDRNQSVTKEVEETTGSVLSYQNQLHDVVFQIPYRWDVFEGEGEESLSVKIEPNEKEHNVWQQIEKSGFVPQVLVGSEPRNNYELENNAISSGFFSIAGGSDPTILENYIFTNDKGQQAHLIMSTQNIQANEETIQFKILQLHFNNLETNYSIIYVNVAEFFRYEVNAFSYTVANFEIMIDGEMQQPKFADSPVFRQLMRDAKEAPEPESLPPARIGGCLIATASYGSELAPQVQLLREMRDNTVLQTQSGTSFMNGFNHLYYSFSPAIADYERENPVFKEAVKLTLTPLLASLTLLQYTDIDSEHEMLGYGIGLILLNIGMYFVAPAILITKIRSFYKLQ
jgi:peptidyl-prolyl cis-trans isomerase B (cyclophilin B)